MIYSIGHSTHPAAVFLELLRANEVRQVADVRAFPRSRRHPQFNRQALEGGLSAGGIGYRHCPGLGGHRTARLDSVNTALRDPAIRGYADHMETPIFRAALDDLLRFAGAGRTAIMCAESDWRECHRRLLSDALLVRGVSVTHLSPLAPPMRHELTLFARIWGQTLSYPGLL